jgi:hypothetical protein
MDQQAQVGDRTQRGTFPSVNEERKQMLENSVKKPEDASSLTALYVPSGPGKLPPFVRHRTSAKKGNRMEIVDGVSNEVLLCATREGKIGSCMIKIHVSQNESKNF